jgi:predicted MFS family arabinose efflux permease
MISRTFHAYLNSFHGLSRETWLLALVSFVNRAGTMVIPFLAVYLTQDLQLPKVQASWVIMSYGIGAVLGTFIGGKLTDKLGYYHVMFWSLFLCGLVFFAMIPLRSVEALVIGTFVLGVIGDAFRPANMASLASYSTPETYIRSLSLVRLAINLGFGMGPALGGFLAYHFGYTWLFVIDGATCIAAALFYRAYLPNRQQDPSENKPAESPPALQSPYTDRPFLLFFGLMVLCGLAFLQFFTLVPVFLKENWHWQENHIGFLVGCNGLIITLVEMPLIYRIEGQYSKMRLVILGVLLIGLAFLALQWFPIQAFAAILCMLGITFGEIMLLPFANGIVVDRAPSGTRGQYLGLYSIAFAVGHILSPAIGLNVIDKWGYNFWWQIVPMLCLVSAIGLFGLGRVGFGRTESTNA